MEILFTNSGDGASVLTCKRNDGSVTWKRTDPFFIYHDLCHYAVETVLPLKNAFYGMVGSGTDISEFDLPKEQRAVIITDEAVFAEHLVNLFVTDHVQGRIEDMQKMIISICGKNGGAVFLPLLTTEKTEEVRNKYNELVRQWKSVPEKKSLQLFYES
jgi:hypothetical protein